MGGALVRINGLDEQTERVARIGKVVRNPARHMEKSIPYFVGQIRKNIAVGGRPTKWPPKVGGGRPLHKTGGMAGAIHGRVVGDEIRIASVKKQSATLHFGATIVAKNADYLHFKIGKQWGKKKSVVIPPRPFLVIIPEVKIKGIKIIADSMEEEINR